MNITITAESADDITTQNLKLILADFKRSLKKKKPLIFVENPVEDKKLIKEHIKAAELMLEYFGV